MLVFAVTWIIVALFSFVLIAHLVVKDWCENRSMNRLDQSLSQQIRASKVRSRPARVGTSKARRSKSVQLAS